MLESSHQWDEHYMEVEGLKKQLAAEAGNARKVEILSEEKKRLD